ncbi:MAG: hypothetical protein Kow0088_21250 [Anaerolineales bacterium]
MAYTLQEHGDYYKQTYWHLILKGDLAKDLGIISENAATRLFHRFRANGWHRQEPGKALASEKPLRMERLIYRALAEDLISRSRAQELLGEPLQLHWAAEAFQQDGVAVGSGH